MTPWWRTNAASAQAEPAMAAMTGAFTPRRECAGARPDFEKGVGQWHDEPPPWLMASASEARHECLQGKPALVSACQSLGPAEGMAGLIGKINRAEDRAQGHHAGHKDSSPSTLAGIPSASRAAFRYSTAAASLPGGLLVSI
jgi:hypothetical protein